MSDTDGNVPFCIPFAFSISLCPYLSLSIPAPLGFCKSDLNADFLFISLFVSCFCSDLLRIIAGYACLDLDLIVYFDCVSFSTFYL